MYRRTSARRVIRLERPKKQAPAANSPNCRSDLAEVIEEEEEGSMFVGISVLRALPGSDIVVSRAGAFRCRNAIGRTDLP